MVKKNNNKGKQLWDRSLAFEENIMIKIKSLNVFKEVNQLATACFHNPIKMQENIWSENRLDEKHNQIAFPIPQNSASENPADLSRKAVALWDLTVSIFIS